MCGRYTLVNFEDEWSETGIRWSSELKDLWQARYNIAPTQDGLVIANTPEPVPEKYRWGLIPPWAKSLSFGAKAINARAETVAQKPLFREALQKRRCLVLADGFYEWKREGKSKLPHRIQLRHGPMAFAGLWERWKSPTGKWIRSFTIITTAPNELMSQLHDRMPLILSPKDYRRWLDPQPLSAKQLQPMLKTFEGQMTMERVRPLVNSVRNEGPELIAPFQAEVDGSRQLALALHDSDSS